MCLTKYPLDEETSWFFNNWGQLTIVDLLGRQFKAKKVIEQIMPAIDGTITIFWKNKAKQSVKIIDGTARTLMILKNYPLENPWVLCFSVKATK